MTENQITEVVIGCAMKVHTKLGPGLLESAYEECTAFEVSKAGLFIERQKALPLIYEEVRMECGYRLDLIVENKVVIEIKSVESINDIHLAQLLTYLRITNCKVGLLLNFNVLKLKDGLKRIVNNY